jgi:hypothetical protein
MTDTDINTKLMAIAAKLAEALKQAKLACQFAPNSYTFACMSAIHAAIKAIEECSAEEVA